MMKTKYKAKNYSNEIELVQIERETEQSVYIDGRKHAKQTEWCCYVDTAEQAKGWLVAYHESEVQRAIRALDYRLEQLAQAKSIPI